MTRFIPGLLISGLLLAPAPASACCVCLCLEHETAQQHIEETELIFDGVVQSTMAIRGMHGANRETTFRVTQAWKGVNRDTLHLRHRSVGSGCFGIDFVPGKPYRVYAERDDKGVIRTNSCMAPSRDWADYDTRLRNYSAGE